MTTLVTITAICSLFIASTIADGVNVGFDSYLVDECYTAASQFRFRWCDALRGNITLDEWADEATAYLARELSSSSTFVNAVWADRDEFLHNETGNVALLLSTIVNEPYQVCINQFSANVDVVEETEDTVTILIPSTKIYQVNATIPSGPPPFSSSTFQILEYDLDRYKCRENNNGKVKVYFYDETQSFTQITEVTTFGPPM